MAIFRKILVPFDFSESSREALKTALHLSQRFGSELLILTVIERNPNSESLKSIALPKDAESRLERKIKEEAHALISGAEQSQFRFQPMVRKGKASLEILLMAESEKVDLILMGTKGQTGLKQVFLGSVAEQVLRRAGAPVWVSRGSSQSLPQKILLPVDFSEYSRQALDQGVRWAQELKAEIFLLHVLDLRYLYALDPVGFENQHALETKLKREAEEELKQWAKSISVSANLEVRLGGPVLQIQDSIQENSIDLVLLSTHGRSGLKNMLMGSVAEQTVRYSPCSVMTICPPAISLSRVKLFDGEKELEDYVRSFRD